MKDSPLVEINTIAFSMGAVSAFMTFFIPVFLAEQGLSGVEIGLLVGIGLIAALFASVPAGIISDRFSGRIAFAASIGMIAFFVAGLNFASGFLGFLLLFVILGIGKETTSRFLEIFTLKAESERDGKKFGSFNLFRFVGSGVGTLLGGIAIGVFSFATAFNAIAALLLLLLIPAFLLKETPKVKATLLEYGRDFLRIKNILFAALLFLFTFHWGAEATAYGLFLKNYLGLNATMSGLYISIPVFFLGAFSFLAGSLVDRKLDYRKLFILGIILSGVGHILMVNPNVFASLFWRIVHEAGDGLFFVTQLVWISLLFKKERIGGNYGIMFTIMTLGAFAGAVVSGPLGETTRYALPLTVSGAILLLEAFALAAYIFGKGIVINRRGAPTKGIY
jgi:MFS family permease